MAAGYGAFVGGGEFVFSPRPSLPGGSSLLCLRKMFSERKREVERESLVGGDFFFIFVAGRVGAAS